jgi:hypothetical protein
MQGIRINLCVCVCVCVCVSDTITPYFVLSKEFESDNILINP